MVLTDSLNSITSTWVTSVDSISEADWIRLFGSANIKSHQLFKAIEDSKFDDITYHYLVVKQHQRVVALLPCFTYTLDLVDILSDKRVKGYVLKVRRWFPQFCKLRYFVVGSYSATCEHFVEIDKSLPEADQQQVKQLVQSELSQRCRFAKCSLVFIKDVRGKYVNDVRSVLSESYQFFSTFPTTVIPVLSRFSYPSALKKKHRQRYRKFKKLFDDRFYWEVDTEFNSAVPLLSSLYTNVLDKAKNKFEVLNQDFFYNLKRSFGDNLFLVVAKDKVTDEVRLMEIVLEEQDRLLPLYLGIRYKEDDTKVLYLNVISRTIQEAERRGGKQLVEFGQTSYYPKVMSGAIAEDICYGFYSPKPLMQLLIKRFFKDVFKPIPVQDHVYLSESLDDLKLLFKETKIEPINLS